MVEEVKFFFSPFQKVFSWVTWEQRDLIFLRGTGWGKILQKGKITKEIKLSLFYRIFKKKDAISGQDQFDVIL